MTDIVKLSEKIDSVGITKTVIASKMGISRECLYQKLSGKSEFLGSEIGNLTDILHLTRDERDAIFFGCRAE